MRTIGFGRKRRERRACAACGHERAVVVHTHVVVEDGVEEEHSESHEAYCEACRYDRRAAVHESQARKFRDRAREIRARRKERADAEG